MDLTTGTAIPKALLFDVAEFTLSPFAMYDKLQLVIVLSRERKVRNMGKLKFVVHNTPDNRNNNIGFRLVAAVRTLLARVGVRGGVERA